MSGPLWSKIRQPDLNIPANEFISELNTLFDPNFLVLGSRANSEAFLLQTYGFIDNSKINAIFERLHKKYFNRFYKIDLKKGIYTIENFELFKLLYHNLYKRKERLNFDMFSLLKYLFGSDFDQYIDMLPTNAALQLAKKIGNIREKSRRVKQIRRRNAIEKNKHLEKLDKYNKQRQEDFLKANVLKARTDIYAEKELNKTISLSQTNLNELSDLLSDNFTRVTDKSQRDIESAIEKLTEAVSEKYTEKDASRVLDDAITSASMDTEIKEESGILKSYVVNIISLLGNKAKELADFLKSKINKDGDLYKKADIEFTKLGIPKFRGKDLINAYGTYKDKLLRIASHILTEMNSFVTANIKKGIDMKDFFEFIEQHMNIESRKTEIVPPIFQLIIYNILLDILFSQPGINKFSYFFAIIK